MKNDVVVVISTYNGSKNIVRQLDSIFKQEGVAVSVLIRDDKSTDNTLEVIKEYQEKNSNNNIIIIEGVNEGYAKSFWDALREAPNASFYAFSDQDDVWKKDKLIRTIRCFDDSDTPQLAYCRMIRTDPDLHSLDEQVNVIAPKQLSKKLVLTQTYNYGAATVINRSAKELVCRHFPESGMVPHDAWIGLLCFWFGKVHFIDEQLYYWVRYNTSVTGEGTRLSGVRFRLRETLKGKSYMNVSYDLLKFYGDLLTDKDRMFLNRIKNYKFSLRDKCSLLFDKDLKRSNNYGTLMLKVGILLNKF